MSTSFRITLEGSQQVPPVVTAAGGGGVAIYDSEAQSLAYTLFVTGLDFGTVAGGAPQTVDPGDDVNGAHFHNKDRGDNGLVIFDWLAEDDDFTAILQPDGSWKIEGLWEYAEDGGSIIPFISALDGAGVNEDVPLYANIHTVDNGGGEIRGQLVGLSTEGGESIAGTAGKDILPGFGGKDAIDGGAEDDILDGGTGKDRLTGGDGDDVFRFSTKLNALKNVDRILDFTDGDTIELDHAAFKKLDPGALLAKAFHAGHGAHDGNDRIIYDGKKLIYDKNGDKKGGDVLFAKIDKDLDLSEADFLVV